VAVNLRHNTSWFLSSFKAAIFTDLTRTVPDITVSRNACCSCFKNALLAMQWTQEEILSFPNSERCLVADLSKDVSVCRRNYIIRHCEARNKERYNIIIQYKPTKCTYSTPVSSACFET